MKIITYTHCRPVLMKPTFQTAVKEKCHSKLGTLSVSIFCSKESKFIPRMVIRVNNLNLLG